MKYSHLETDCSLEKVMQLIAAREREEAGLSANAWVLALLACDGFHAIRDAAGVEVASEVTRALARWMFTGESS